MNALLLCAGSARRFYPDGDSRPKCLLPLSHSETILDRILRQLKGMGCSTLIGTGCGHEQVVAHLNKSSHRVQTVYNPEYATTNSIVTLWQMRHYISGDTLLINGDVVIEDGTLALFEEVNRPQLLVKHQAEFDDDTYRVRFDAQHRVLAMGKELNDEPSDNCAAFLGISRVGNASRFLREIEKLLQIGTYQTWPTTAYRALIQDVGVTAVDIGERLFFDIDTPQEYSLARESLDRRTSNRRQAEAFSTP
jgi:choline kinase